MNSISGTFVKMLLLMSVLLFFSIVHAEGNCPDGYYPLGTPGGGWQGCAPLPGNDPAYQHAPQQRWVDQWGAIASDFSHGSIGVSTDNSTKRDAETNALGDCQSRGGHNCKVEISYYNQCSALVVGDKTHNSGSAATIDKAVQLGIKVCSSGGDINCHAYYSACSLPKRIQ
jgi:hypothetical protein